MRVAQILLAACIAVAAGPRVARANDGTSTDVPPGPPPPMNEDIVIQTPGTRPTLNLVTISVVAGLGVVAGGIGVYENLEARKAANDLSGDGNPSRTWTPALANEQHDLHHDNTGAAIGYSVGGALLVGTVVFVLLTQPPGTTTVIHPRLRHASVAPTAGGAMLGGSWSF
jgi:hypothetical protein